MLNVQLSSLSGGLLVVVAVLAVLQLTLDVVALVDLVRRPVERVALGNKWVWVAIILLVNVIGAIVYLAVGRKPADVAEVPPPTELSPRAGSIADSLYGPRAAAPDAAPGPAAAPGSDEPASGPEGVDPR